MKHERPCDFVRLELWLAGALAILASASCSGTATPGVPNDAADPRGEGELPVPTRYSEAREPCADHNPLRNAYWGDLHVHSAWSMDAFALDVRTTPTHAYRFAQGEAIPLLGDRTAQLERPLDFLAVTEHASYLGETGLCTRPDSPAYEHPRCQRYRGEGMAYEGLLGAMGARLAAVRDGGVVSTTRPTDLCGDDFGLCLESLDSVWTDLAVIAERFYDRSGACRFTTFNAYEYTANPGYSKVHRNVVFRNASIPRRPITWVDEPDVWKLWEGLRRDCLEAGNGCDVLTIPHNSNMSNGRMFALDYPSSEPSEQRRLAALRERLEPLIEVMQTKGDSECRNDLWKVEGGPDPFCDFEKLRPLDRAQEACRGGIGARGLAGEGCQSRRDFARYTLVEGLREVDRIGVNPLKLGMTASTDYHNSNPGDVEESSFQGILGLRDDTPNKRLGTATLNPGGLVGVWAEENSRDALFDALRRRETFGTSGPRIQPRLFGGWTYDAELCEQVDVVERAYARGVPMGGDLPPRPAETDATNAAPVFVATALADPGVSGLPTQQLQRIQIIKGWAGDDNVIHQAVYDTAGGPNDASVDTDTCEVRGRGHGALCGVWRDPDFDPAQRAVYYARVLENPSCRWSTRECNALPDAERPGACADPNVPKVIQERAWTSPIWYEPAVGQPGRSS
jgi:hypothetical protein